MFRPFLKFGVKLSTFQTTLNCIVLYTYCV
nr:MAG TPA: hypothetical protein [Caudoviricetes sp.]